MISDKSLVAIGLKSRYLQALDITKTKVRGRGVGEGGREGGEGSGGGREGSGGRREGMGWEWRGGYYWDPRHTLFLAVPRSPHQVLGPSPRDSVLRH